MIDNEKLKKLEELKKKGNRAKFQEKVEMAQLQETLHECKIFEDNKNKIIKLVRQEWKDLPFFEFDYNDIYGDKRELLQKKIWDAYGVGKYESLDYIWGTLRNDGMLISIGKTSKGNDDLFKLLGRGRKSNKKSESLLDYFPTATEKIILSTTLNPYQIEEYTDVLKDFELMLEEVNKILRGYIRYAFAIPLDPKDNLSAELEEQKLGEYLEKEGIPILNYYSHKNFK
ncbi:hypothetical protein [Marinilactibacillus psychrotolerans]|uniref:Uncharacterized protein n=1 Tax=Marinilactibacillus psychrotolerans TaxID=191770 RepID=A0ABW8UGD4_9LACT